MPPHLQSNTICTPPISELNLKYRIGFQVVKGVMTHESIKHNALVLVQGWPSWAFALDGLGFKSITTLGSFWSLSSRDEFKCTSLGNTLIDRSNLTSWLVSNHSNDVVFVQGNWQFLEDTFKDIKSFNDLKLVFACNDQSFWTCDGWRELHSAAGGVTNNKLTFYKQNVHLSSNALPQILQSLWHVLKTTEGESAKFKLKLASHEASDIDSRICWNDKYPKVLAYLVFHKDGWVDWLITNEEMLDIYDLELSMRANLKSFLKKSGVTLTWSYVD